MSKGEPIPIEEARAIANEFIAKTQTFYDRIELAGSIARKEPFVKDIDVVAIAANPFLENAIGLQVDDDSYREIVEKAGGTIIQGGDKYPFVLFRDTQINVRFTTHEAWGATLMWYTGPKGHQIGMNIKAKKLGFIFTPEGIFSRDKTKFYETQTEQDVAELLNWTWKSPEERGKK